MHHVHQACSFIRRHKRVIALAGVTAAAIAGVCKVRADLHTIAAMQAEQQARAAEERRFRLYIGRARSECRVAVLSFLPTLRRRLYTTVDIATPVRDLKLLRQSQQNADAAADASEESDLAAAETALWDAVKVTGFTRLVLAMYSFSALNLMLRLQLHILGRHSYEEARQLLQQHAVAAAALASRHPTAASSMHSTDRIDTAAAAVAAAAAGVGTALPMEARHAFLSATYEYLLGEGMVSLSETVTAAVQKYSAGWHCQTKAEVGCDELIAMLKRVRREVEGHQQQQQQQTSLSGSVFSTNNTNSEQAVLLRYIINPNDATTCASSSSASSIESSSASSKSDDHDVNSSADSILETVSSSIDGAATTAASQTAESAQQQQQQQPEDVQYSKQVQTMLFETWDAVESPNFKYALQDSLDAAFDVLHRRIRDRIYSTAAAGTAGVASTLSASEHEQHDFEEPRPALASVVSATK
eukprot:18503-Heterococcus_DN1.PRE.1